MAALDNRIARLNAERDVLYEAFVTASAYLAKNIIESTRCQLLHLAEQDARIVEFGIDGEFTYDDEGGYYYGANLNALDAEGEPVFEFAESEPGELCMEDKLNEIAHMFGEEEAEVIFGSRWDAVITLEQLRSALADAS